jgi:HPt (histidine-containing phosphotransfer) domain-containing protein
MSGHNEAQTVFQKMLPEIIGGILRDLAAFGRDQLGREPLGASDRLRDAERAFLTSMEGLFAHIRRQLDSQEKPASEMSPPELDELAQKLAASLRGG